MTDHNVAYGVAMFMHNVSKAPTPDQLGEIQRLTRADIDELIWLKKNITLEGIKANPDITNRTVAYASKNGQYHLEDVMHILRLMGHL